MAWTTDKDPAFENSDKAKAAKQPGPQRATMSQDQGPNRQSGQSEPKVENKGNGPNPDQFSPAGPPVPGWPKLAGPVPAGERPAQPGAEGSKISAEHLKNWWTGGGWNKDVDAERIRVVRTIEGWGPDAPDHLRAPERYIDCNKFGEVVQVRNIRGIRDDSATTLAIVTGAKVAQSVAKAGIAATARSEGSKEVRRLVAAAGKPYNETGLSVAARKIAQHAGRPGGTFKPPTGSIAEQNEAASRFIRTVLTDPKAVRTKLSGGGFEYRLPGGKGVRFNPDGTFNTVLDPKLPKQ
jgi:filamentous hemagglutinin